MKTGLLLTGLLFALHLVVAGQSLDCSNIGFEEGTTRGWVLTNGSVTDIAQQTVYQNEVAGTFENGHLITKAGSGNDPNVTAEAIPMVAPGSQYSLRIGNVTRGSRFDRIRGSFVVTADNTLFQYRFAVILQNPTHQPYQQPGFSVRVTNQAGATLGCSDYDVFAAASISGFKAQGDIRYRNWTTGSIDLRPYVGQTVTIEVTAHGCTERRHYGYAYFDAQCLKTEITQALFCPGVDQTMTLKAPEGFATYAWNTGETTATIRVAPVQGTTYRVTVTPYSSLNSSCQLSLDYTLKVSQPVMPTKQTVSICEGDSYQVGEASYQTAGTYLTPIKRGAYLTRINQPNAQCDSLITTQLVVSPFSLSLSPNALIRPSDTTQLRVLVTSGTGSIRLSWSPAASLNCPTCAVTTARPTETTQYTLLAENTTLGCQRTGIVLVRVGTCLLYIPDAFSPNQDGVNDVFTIPANTCIQTVHRLTVFDRWGEVLYDRVNLQAGELATGWDGTFQGAACTNGVYTYKIDVELIDGWRGQHRGRLILIR